MVGRVEEGMLEVYVNKWPMIVIILKTKEITKELKYIVF